MIDTAFMELAAKAIGLLGSIFTAYKLLLEVVLNRKPRLREEYKFAKEFLADVATSTQPHPYLVEKGFAAVSGQVNLTAAEILYLLAQPNPSLSFKRYSAARQRYVEYSESEQRVNYKGKYSDAGKRKWAKGLNFGGYFIHAMLAFAPLFFASDLFGKNWQMAVVFILMFLVAFGPQAIMCMIEFGRIKKGEKLVESQCLPKPTFERDRPETTCPSN